MKKLFFLIFGSMAALEMSAARVVEYVDPFIGTSGNGHTTPAAARPFGMVQPGPDTGNGDWGHCSGYRFEETTLYGFSQTHLSGTGCGDLGDFLIKPFVEGAALAPQTIDKATEKAQPGYYAVTAGGVATEITATRCAALYRIKFPAGSVPKVLFDSQWVLVSWPNEEAPPRVEKSFFRPDEDRKGFVAFRRVDNWAKNRDVYIALSFSVPWRKVEKLERGEDENAERCLFTFPEGLRELEIRLALSRTDETAAKRNLALETDNRTFDEIRADASREWDDLLSRVEASGDEARLKTLYTSLYHLFYSPNMISDVGEKPYYSTFSFWDTFRAAHPLYTILVPERVPGMVNSILRDAHARDMFPIWPLWGCETECMIGTHSIPVVVDAYLKGLLPDLDVKKTMRLIHRTLSHEHARLKEGWPILKRFGYYPADLVEDESVSRTLECAYDDACAARFAKAIGDKEMEELYAKRAGVWRNLFDRETMLMRPKKADGKFAEPFDPFRQGQGSGFTEGNAWQYTWHVMHDPEGLIEAFGGKAAFADRLEKLFKLPEDAAAKYKVLDVTGLIGQYAHGNEPSHHVPFFFTLAGRPERTNEIVREICEKFYFKATPDGLCGNDDCGQMSAWYIFACLGMYPFDPCGGEYIRFEPVIPGIKIKVPSSDAGEDPASRKDYYFGTYARDARVKDNTFISECVDNRPLPPANLWRTAVPKAIWDGHPNEVAAFSNSWEMVGAKLHKPEANTNFKRNFVYTPFGKSVFVWGSSFITMFGQYASNVFSFIEQLDNFYAAQTPDGFMPRQLGIYDGRSQFERNDLSSVGGNIFAWAELEWYRFSGDKERLKRVYPVLMAYHDWMRKNRTWKDGTYFSSGWGCGMDNIPRMDTTRYSAEFHHGFISFVDVTMQQIFNAKNLLAIADLAGIARDKSLEDEIAALEKIANEKMWDEATGLYHDLDREGNRVPVRHIGGFWALLARVAPPERARRLARSLADGATFAAPCGTRSLAKGAPGYERDGGNYWRGGVWCITDWAIVRGLAECGLYEDAHNLAMRHVCAVAKVYADTGTVWESYDPEKVTHGKLYGQSVRRDFVGFSGVTPIAMLVRDVFGMEFTPGKVVWRVRLLERHGIENLTLPDGNVVSLICEKRSSLSEKPVIKVLSDKPFKVEVK